MRTAFIQQLLVEARRNPRIWLVVGDLGYSVVEPFAREFPERFLNAGVAEQNMTGVAAGLASEGWQVFTYSIANFPTLRCLEQIRNDICYHQLPVTIVAVGAGLAYGNLGYSHHGIQDIGCLRGFPNLTIFSPADPGETRACVRRIVDQPAPCYLRLGKAGEPDLHASTELGTGLLRVTGGEDSPLSIVATGAILQEALEATSCLPQVAVYSLPLIAPLPPSSLAPLWRHGGLVTVEEHVRAGGVGEFLASYCPPHVRHRIVSVDRNAAGFVGSQSTLRRICGIDAESIRAALNSLSL